MALTETMIIQTANDPVTINNMNNEWGCFGWSVLSIQITHSQDSRTYTRGLDYLTGDLTTETTTINYATITYQRDRQLPNRAQIAALQQQYNQLRQELADEVARIQQADYSQQAKDLFSTTRKDLFRHPVQTYKKQWGAVFNIGKKLFTEGNAYSDETVQRTNDLTNQYAIRLNEIRQEAESLL